MAFFETGDEWNALDQHVRGFFAGHTVATAALPDTRIHRRLPGFFIYEIGPGPAADWWSYLTAGCWQATAHEQDGHGLEFILAANTQHEHHPEILTWLAHYHAGPATQRHDLGHTSPIGEPWMPGSACEYTYVELPYPWGPDIETCEWDGGHARILHALPITAAEKRLCRTHGSESLEQALEDAEADFTDPMRQSVA